MPRTHQHKPGESLGNINHNDGRIEELARCQHCGQSIVKGEKDVNWRTIAESVIRRTRSVPASKI